jgi:hypothetical protein
VKIVVCPGRRGGVIFGDPSLQSFPSRRLLEVTFAVTARVKRLDRNAECVSQCDRVVPVEPSQRDFSLQEVVLADVPIAAVIGTNNGAAAEPGPLRGAETVNKRIQRGPSPPMKPVNSTFLILMVWNLSPSW